MQSQKQSHHHTSYHTSTISDAAKTSGETTTAVAVYAAPTDTLLQCGLYVPSPPGQPRTRLIGAGAPVRAVHPPAFAPPTCALPSPTCAAPAVLPPCGANPDLARADSVDEPDAVCIVCIAEGPISPSTEVVRNRTRKSCRRCQGTADLTGDLLLVAGPPECQCPAELRPGQRDIVAESPVEHRKPRADRGLSGTCKLLQPSAPTLSKPCPLTRTC